MKAFLAGVKRKPAELQEEWLEPYLVTTPPGELRPTAERLDSLFDRHRRLLTLQNINGESVLLTPEVSFIYMGTHRGEAFFFRPNKYKRASQRTISGCLKWGEKDAEHLDRARILISIEEGRAMDLDTHQEFTDEFLLLRAYEETQYELENQASQQNQLLGFIKNLFMRVGINPPGQKTN